MRIPKNPFKPIRYQSFKDGRNTLVSVTKIKPTELVNFDNGILIEDGAVTKRPGQMYFGNDTGLGSISGLFQFKKSDGTTQLLLGGDTKLRMYNISTGNFDVMVAGPTMTAGLDLSMVQAYDKVFCCNGVDSLFSYDGSTFTIYTALTLPTGVNLTLNGGATSGSFSYSYRVSARNAAGETLASPSVVVTSNQSNLTSTYSITVAWTAVTNAVSYSIYGRKNTYETFLASVDAPTVTFTDTGGATPSLFFGPQDTDSTAGRIGKLLLYSQSSLIILMDTNNKSRVYFSAGGSTGISNFGTGAGGGFIDISKSDGEVLTGGVEFQNDVLVFKNNSVWKLAFTGGAVPNRTNVTRTVGCVAYKTIKVVENDVFFLSDHGVYVIGNEPNYVGVIRTNELSAKVRPDIQNINTTILAKSVASYFDFKYRLSVPDGGNVFNNVSHVYDRERLAWYRWTAQNDRVVASYVDANSKNLLLSGQDSGGRVVQKEIGTTDFGMPIHFKITTRSEEVGQFETSKYFKNFAAHFRNVNGQFTLKISNYEQGVYKIWSINPNPNNQFKTNQWGKALWGAPILRQALSNQAIVERPNVRFRSRWFNWEVEHNSFGTITVLDFGVLFKLMSANYFPSSERLSDNNAVSQPDVVTAIIYDGGKF